MSCHPVVDARIRPKPVPERAENCGRQRSPTGNPNGVRSGHTQVDPCAKRTSKQRVAGSTTPITSSRYRCAVDCGSPKPAPSRGISPLFRNQASPKRLSVTAQPAGSLPRPDPAASGQQPGNEPDQVPGNVERDTIRRPRGASPRDTVLFGEASSTGAPRLPGDLRLCRRVFLYV